MSNQRITRRDWITILLWPLLLQVIAYYNFNSTVREFQLKSASIFADGVHVIETREKNVEAEYWSVTVENRGDLPVNNLTVTFKTAELANAGQPTVDPPLPHTTEKKDDTASVALSAPFAPAGKIKVVLPQKREAEIATHASIPDVSAWVSSEANITQVGWRQARKVNVSISIGPANGSVSVQPASPKH